MNIFSLKKHALRSPLCFIFALLFISKFGFSQDGVGINTTTIDPNAILDINVGGSVAKGIKLPLLPASTALQDMNGANPGIMFFDSESNQLYNSIEVDNGTFDWDPSGWGMRGTANTDINKHALGTTDNTGLNIVTNSQIRVRIRANGKMGIGLTNPSEMLEVNGAIKIGPAQNSGDGTIQWTGNDLELYKDSGWISLTNTSSADNDWTVGNGTVYNITDKIGIGTSSPGTNLHIKTSNDAFSNFQTTDNTWLYTQWLDASGTRRSWMGLDADISDFRISVENGTNYLILDAPNVKIGDANSNNYKLDINTPSNESATYGIYNSFSSTPSSNTFATGGAYHINNSNTNGTKYGIRNTVNSTGTGLRYGFHQTVYGNSSSSSSIFGLYSYMYSNGSGAHYGLRLHDASSSSGTQYGIYSTGEDMNYFEGDIGIGVVSPNVALDVNGVLELSNVNPSDPGSDVVRLGDGGTNLEIQTNYGYVRIGPQNTTWSHFYTDRSRYYFDKEIRVDQGYIGSYDDDLSLRTSGVTRMTLSNSDGHIGIATTTPLSDLHIKQSGGSGASQGTGGINLEATSNSSFHWRIYNSSNYVRFNYSSNGGSSYTAKAYVLPSDGSWNVQSDKSLKKDVKAIDDVLSRVKQLEVLEYHYLDNPKDAPLSIGFFAQDVEPLFPNIVSKENENSKLGIDYGKFAVISIKAIQEQQDLIDQLQKKVDELEEKIKKLDRK